MQLLDLPPEIFQRIVGVLVKKHGLKDAWKLRGTSKSFRTYITYEILATPSLYAYNKTPATREILTRNLADFLYVRSTTLNGFVRTHVPNFIRDVLVTLSPWVTTDVALCMLRKALCELFVRNHTDALKCVLTDVNKLNGTVLQTVSVSDTVNLVAAAAASGSVDALRHLADKNRPLLWVNSASFGYPLDAAVYTGQFSVVKAIARQAITNQRHAVTDIPHAEHLAFRTAICTSIKIGHDDMTNFMLNTYISAFGPATECCMKAWLDAAIIQDKASIVTLLLSTSTQANISTIYNAFTTACRRVKPSLLPLFFAAGIPNQLSLNTVYGSTYPLLTAIDRDSTPIVKQLLKLGADPNGPNYLAGLERPLKAATRSGSGKQVAPLLAKGANPWLAVRSGWKKMVLNRYALETRTGIALREAFYIFREYRMEVDDGGFLAAAGEEEDDEEGEGLDMDIL